MPGKVYAIGLGPGDPELITVKAQRLLHELAAVYLPVREGHASLARKIAEKWVEPAKLRELPFSMSKKVAENAQRWREHARMLAEAARSAGEVGFLTEGDPLLYSTFGNLLGELRSSFADVALEFVPGVTSVTAAAAACGLPLGQESQRLAIVPASGDVLHALATFDTVVILKVSMNLAGILKALRATGRLGEATYVERATWPEQRIIHDLESLDPKKMDYFGQIIVVR
ncbi:MAG: precorrin-2 C(20)-methyltransferase [Chloroflexota bacterium]|nr:precorrin-2 C(20)-methyltransferase [Chloroflexota bacterium]